jgi:N-formylglutamate amidohydrolase
MKLNPQDLAHSRVDRVMDAPFSTDKLVETLAELMKLDGSQFIDKLTKMNPVELSDVDLDREFQFVHGASPMVQDAEMIRGKAREDRYRKVVEQTPIDKSHTTFQKADLKERWKEIVKGWDAAVVDDLRRLRVEFTKALFRKKP